jgi:nitrilase
VPTNHERLVWGPGDGGGLEAVETPLGRIGGLICWENYMPLARFALYESGVELYIASTADDGEAWQSTIVHIARESRAFVIAPSHFQRASSYPDAFPLRPLLEELDVIGRAGRRSSAPTAPTSRARSGTRRGSSTPSSTAAARRGAPALRPVGHYHRPDVLGLERRV